MKATLDRNFLLLFIAVFIIFFIASLYYYHKSVQPDDSISWVDFRVYYYAGLRLGINADIYEDTDIYFIYKYSPIFALAMSVIRFSTVTPKAALRVWYVILFIAFILSLYLVKRILLSSGKYPCLPVKNYRFPGLDFFDIVPALFAIRYLGIINFIHSYSLDGWPAFLKIYDKLFFYVLGPAYLLSLFVTREENVNYSAHANLKDRLKSFYPAAILGFTVFFILRFLILN
ncbi:MAG: hypothetical protein JW994_01390, partial [Candidatus Omnitrophica bacterium]|nr:hypothetical protein [Candidatus Omnitrophota bacterium]